ncbi:MAG: hypothetical protein A2020_16385 [Lentisphaerae bacterium GWF2_45_14]|nr:MAG: hypothetical protein A2020_16385 [Lentisphaerae bacterium GWF2_45_14]
MATYVRGVNKTGVPTMGLLQNLNSDKGCEFAVAEDEAGEVAAEEAFGQKVTGNFEVVYDSTQTLPDPGDVISVRSVNYTVDSVSEKESNKDFKRVTINYHRYITNGIPAA